MKMVGAKQIHLRLCILAVVMLRAVTAYNCVRLRGAAGSCYIFKSSPMTWRDAVSDCVTRHSGHLVTFETETEQNAIKTHLRSGKHAGLSHYTGAISIDGHRSWFWYNTGALLRDNQWEDSNGQNCLALNAWAGSSAGLTDVVCWERKPYVCEVLTPDYADYYGNFRLEERSNDWPWG